MKIYTMNGVSWGFKPRIMKYWGGGLIYLTLWKLCVVLDLRKNWINDMMGKG